MKKRCLLIVLTLAATLAAAVAQQPTTNPSSPSASAAKPTPTPAPPPPPAPRTMPPDQRAYMEATRIKEPQKKLEALEKWLEQYPESFNAATVHLDILDTIIKFQPDQKEKILAQADRAMQKAASGFASGNTANNIATRLLRAGLLAEAEQYAQKAVAATDEYLAQMMKEFQRQKARPLATLGQVYLKQDKLKEAEQKLKAAYAIYPQEAGVAVGLAEIAEKKGKDKEAVDYLLAAGRLKPEERRKLETFWRKTHNNSLNGLEEELDARYHKEFSGLVPVTRYQPAAKRSNRAVLAEVFTGAACGPCVAADVGFEAMMERYSRQELIVVMYHQHIPGPDPMTNPATLARFRFYGGGGVPSYTIDGLGLQSGGGSKEMTKGFYQRVNPAIERRLEVAAEANLKLDAALVDGVVKVAAQVAFDKAALEKAAPPAKAEPQPAGEAKDAAKGGAKSDAPVYKLHVLLVEEMLRYPGENGIRLHPVVVRAMGGLMANGFALDPAKAEPINARFDLAAISDELKKYLESFEASRSKDRDEPYTFSEKKHEINANNLSVVAFVQEEKSKKVLQAATVRLNGKGVAMK
jgi:tetratricopeptide (TPR) repeat protein